MGTSALPSFKGIWLTPASYFPLPLPCSGAIKTYTYATCNLQRSIRWSINKCVGNARPLSSRSWKMLRLCSFFGKTSGVSALAVQHHKLSSCSHSVCGTFVCFCLCLCTPHRTSTLHARRHPHSLAPNAATSAAAGIRFPVTSWAAPCHAWLIYMDPVAKSQMRGSGRDQRIVACCCTHHTRVFCLVWLWLWVVF